MTEYHSFFAPWLLKDSILLSGVVFILFLALTLTVAPTFSKLQATIFAGGSVISSVLTVFVLCHPEGMSYHQLLVMQFVFWMMLGPLGWTMLYPLWEPETESMK
jgi:hypothetical protein